MDDDCIISDGVDVPNYTQFPNVFLDWALPRMSGAEFKVLAFLVRCTWGYHVYDAPVPISLLSIIKGTGCSRATVVAALKDFEEHGFIRVAHHESSEHGTERNTYHLRVRPQFNYHTRPSDSRTSPSAVGEPPPIERKIKERSPQPPKEIGVSKYAQGRYAVCAACGSRPCVCDEAAG